MILADNNIWLALAISRHPFHSPVERWFSAQMKIRPVLFIRSTQQSFLRLITTEALTGPYGLEGINNAFAWKMYDAFLADSRVAFATEPSADKLAAQWQRFTTRNTASPKLWMDAYLAAFAVVGGHQLVTTDKAFEQFESLDLIVLPEP